MSPTKLLPPKACSKLRATRAANVIFGLGFGLPAAYSSVHWFIGLLVWFTWVAGTVSGQRDVARILTEED